MTMMDLNARVAWLAIGAALLGMGCPTTYVVLGNEISTGGTVGGAAGAAGGAGVGGAGGTGGTAGSCVVNAESVEFCSTHIESDTYDFNACVNSAVTMQTGVGGAPAARCEGYVPCSQQFQACTYYWSEGAAGSLSADGGTGGCAGSYGDEAWRATCGGSLCCDGYNTPEQLRNLLGMGGAGGGTSGAGGAGGG